MGPNIFKRKLIGLTIARSLAFASLAGLALTFLTEGNYAFSSLFLVLSLYYLKKLIRYRESQPKQIPSQDWESGKRRSPHPSQAELADMLDYYRRLTRGWKTITLTSWATTALVFGFFRTPFVAVILGLAGYATYAFFRSRKAVHLIAGAVGRLEGDL